MGTVHNDFLQSALAAFEIDDSTVVSSSCWTFDFKLAFVVLGFLANVSRSKCVLAIGAAHVS
jgi:hypothetical protein